MGERSKCGRWNPTAEQVKVLTELFRSGLRTPTTYQIQNISSQLSFYGNIESKNVFYWFQNHKARERHKRPKLSFHHTYHHLTNNIPTQNSLITSSPSSSSPNFAEMNHVSERESVMETLQLFPLNSFDESESQKLRMQANECRDRTTMFSYTMVEQMEHPPLDLRLSFM